MKRIILSAMMLCFCLFANAQATDLVIDNQTPGWLSSKINYDDQMTVKNLKVTGYLNNDDLRFIGYLIYKNLTGVLDLYDAQFVEGGQPNSQFSGLFDIYNSDYDTYQELQKLYLPHNQSFENLEIHLYIDSLIYDTQDKVMPYINKVKVDYLEIGENIEELSEFDHLTKSVKLPSSLKRIDDKKAFADGSNCSHTPDERDIMVYGLDSLINLEYLGSQAFERIMPESFPDTLRLPSIKSFAIDAICFYKEGMHIYLGENLKSLSYLGVPNIYSTLWHPSLKNIVFHLANKEFVKIRYDSTPPTGATFYVQKDLLNQYQTTYKNIPDITFIAEPNPLVSIALDRSEIVLDVNEEVLLTASPVPSNADNLDMIWEVDDPQVVSVSQTGEIKALSSGNATITVSSSDGQIKAECTVVVKTHASSVKIEPSEIEISELGETAQLYAYVLPEETYDKTVKWTSSNTAICSVNESGLVMATGCGTTVVYVTTNDGGYTASCVIKVPRHIESIFFNKSLMDLKVGESEQLNATILPSDASNKKLIWTTEDAKIATVDEWGTVTALKAGETMVTATSDDKKDILASCKIIITQPATGISLNMPKCTLTEIGESAELEATVTPEDASNKNVKWKSSDESVCIVANGTVVAVGNGICVIIATAEDGGHMATCTVTVSIYDSVKGVNGAETITIESISDAAGRRINTLQRGVNILRMSDGTTKKVMVK